MQLYVAHLFPELLNIYGDKGNIASFAKRCLWRDIGLNICEINIGDKIDPDFISFVAVFKICAAIIRFLKGLCKPFYSAEKFLRNNKLLFPSNQTSVKKRWNNET